MSNKPAPKERRGKSGKNAQHAPDSVANNEGLPDLALKVDAAGADVHGGSRNKGAPTESISIPFTKVETQY